MDPKLVIAASVLGIFMMLVSSAVIANMIGQFKMTGHYEIPPFLIEQFNHLINVAIGILGALGIGGSIAHYRKSKKSGKNNAK